MDRLSSPELGDLVKAAAAVAGTAELHDVLETTVDLARKLTGAKYGALGVLGSFQTLSDFVHRGMDPGLAAKIGHLPVGKGVLGTLIRRPEPVRLEHLSEHPDFVGFPEHHPPMETFLGVPVLAGDEVYGNLYLTDKPTKFTADDQAKVEALAAIAGSAVASARLRERLTKLAIVEDRERIARDLHDTVIQNLFAVGLTLQSAQMAIDDDRAKTQVDGAIDEIDHAISSLRTFIFDLTSLDTAMRDPQRAVRRVVERITAPRGLEVTTDLSALTPIAEHQLDLVLHFVREAASNAIRHARAQRLEIVAERDNHLRVVVTDDGVGFDTTSTPGGNGLANMRERTGAKGGTFTVRTSPGAGTTVAVSLPL